VPLRTGFHPPMVFVGYRIHRIVLRSPPEKSRQHLHRVIEAFEIEQDRVTIPSNRRVKARSLKSSAMRRMIISGGTRRPPHVAHARGRTRENIDVAVNRNRRAPAVTADLYDTRSREGLRQPALNRR